MPEAARPTPITDHGVAEGHLAECEAENQRLRACLRHIGEVAESAALGHESVGAWWYGAEAQRALNRGRAHHATPQEQAG